MLERTGKPHEDTGAGYLEPSGTEGHKRLCPTMDKKEEKGLTSSTDTGRMTRLRERETEYQLQALKPALFFFLAKKIFFCLFVCLFVWFGFVFLPFLGLLPWHMEVPRLGVQSEP